MNVVITEEEAIVANQPEPSPYNPPIPENYWDHSLNLNYTKSLREMIDNTLNNRFDNQNVNFVVQHILNTDGEIQEIQFHDDGMGVDTNNRSELDGWIGIKIKKTVNQLSTHGVGMKHALAAFNGTKGVNWVATNHSEAGYCSFDTIGQDMKLYHDDRYWKNRPDYMLESTGHSASVRYNTQGMCKAPKSVQYSTGLINELGAVYKYMLYENRLSIRFEWIQNGKMVGSTNVDPIFRPYVFNSKAEPEINRQKIVADDNSWSILLSFGKNAQSKDELVNIVGIDPNKTSEIIGGSTRHPYANSQKTTGVDIVEHDRVIELNAKHLLCRYNEETGEAINRDDKSNRPDFVGNGGEIRLLHGFKTTETKEILKNLAYWQMCNKVYDYLVGKNPKQKNFLSYDPTLSSLKGNEWRDAVAAYLIEEDKPFEGKTATIEKPLPDSYNVNTDIFIEEENLPIECKACEVEFGHVAKFRSEMEIHGVEKGWIVSSKGFSDDAKREIQRLKTKGITIEMKDWKSKASRVLLILED